MNENISKKPGLTIITSWLKPSPPSTFAKKLFGNILVYTISEEKFSSKTGFNAKGVPEDFSTSSPFL
jgi:hypothetical protein